MEPDTITPIIGIRSELTVQFALGYTAAEFDGALQSIANGSIDVSHLITGEVGLDDVPRAFEMLAKPDEQAKILVEPALSPQ